MRKDAAPSTPGAPPKRKKTTSSSNGKCLEAPTVVMASVPGPIEDLMSPPSRPSRRSLLKLTALSFATLALKQAAAAQTRLRRSTPSPCVSCCRKTCATSCWQLNSAGAMSRSPALVLIQRTAAPGPTTVSGLTWRIHRSRRKHSGLDCSSGLPTRSWTFRVFPTGLSSATSRCCRPAGLTRRRCRSACPASAVRLDALPRLRGTFRLRGSAKGGLGGGDPPQL